MAIPTGSGLELLRRGAVNGLTDSATQLNFAGVVTASAASQTVPANHIITMILMIWCEQAGNAETIQMGIHDGAASINLFYNVALAAEDTFVWNTKFVLIGGDYCTTESTSGNVDLVYTYLDQDWS